MSNVKKVLALLVVAMMVLLTACGEQPVDTNTTTTAGGDVVVTTTTAGDDVTTTVGDDVTTTVGDDVTTTVGDDVTTTVGDVTTTVGNVTTTQQQQQATTTTTQQQQQATTTTTQQQQQQQVTTVVTTTTVQGVVATTTRRTQRTQGGNNSGSSSDDFRGKTVIIMSRDNFSGSADIQKAYKSGIDTWATRYGSKVDFRIADYGYGDLQAAIAGGESPDLFYQVERFPEICAVGLVQPVDEYLPEGQQVLVGKSIEYGSWRGHLWGMGIGGGGRMYLSFDRELFKAYPTVKTPRQYFEEGNWTWDTFRTCAKEIMKATGGTYGVNFSQFATAGGHNIISVSDDGRVTSTLATDTHNKDLLQWVYNLKTKDKVFDTEKYAISKYQGDAEPKYGANGETKVNLSDVWQEIVPFPANPKTGEYTSCEQVFSFVVPVGAQNPAMSVDLALSILSPWKQTVDGYNYCAYEKKVRESVKNASALLKYPDVLTYLPYAENDATYGSLYTMGTAQAINSLKDVHAADCKTYNDTYIK